MSRNRRRLLLFGAAVALLLVAARLAAITYADYAWFDIQGARSLWWAKLWNGVLLLGSTWIAGTIFVFLNVYAVLRSVRHLIVARQVANIEIEAAVPGRLIMAAAAVASAAVGALLMLVQDDWTTLALARYVPPFGLREPSLGADVVFWVAQLPLERAWYTWAQSSMVAVSTLVVLLYAVTRSLRWTPTGLHATSYVRRHLSTLGALLLILLAWNYRLERLLLPVNLGSGGYFGIVEQRMLTVLLVLAVFTAACAILVLWAGYVGQTRVAFASVTAIIVVALGLQQGGPALIRWSSAGDLESPQRIWPYLGTQASFTRTAYGVPRVVPVDSTRLVTELSRLDRAVGVWDAAAVVAAVERSGRRREVVGGVGWQVDSLGLWALAAAREVPPDSLRPDDGWVLATVRATPPPDEVVPVPRVRTIPPALVYPGARGDILVVDSAGSGVAAPGLGRGLRRFAHALAEQDLRLFFDPAPDPRLRLLSHRDVGELVRALAPIFEPGMEIVPVSTGDSLYWALPLYVSSRSFPLSHPWTHDGRVTKYFQHAATAIVNAHSGRLRLVIAPSPDPIASAWARRFPALFVSVDSLPPALANALPLPETAVVAQAFAFGATGADGERQTPLVLPGSVRSDSLGDGVAALPYAPSGGSTAARAVPLLDATTERLIEIYVVSGGARPRASVFHVDTATESWPEQLERLRQHLGRDGGATAEVPVIQTRPRLLPTGSGVMLVQPAYAWRPDGIPALARVAVLHGDSLRAAASLSALGPLDRQRPPGAPGNGAAAALYERMREALRRADWTTFGQAFEALGRVLGVTGKATGVP
ncbi:MAG: UPF0182 family protein [Gemmatimonadaceae bacterium]